MLAEQRFIPKHEHQDSKKRDPNQEQFARLGICRVVNDGWQDNHRRHDNHNNHNQNSAHFGASKASNDRKYNQRRCDNQDNYNRHDNGMYGNKNRWEKYEKQGNRWEGGQNRRDFRNRQDDIPNRRDYQNRQDGHMNRTLSVQRNRMYPIVAHTWRVVCDSMLGGLSSKLRMCGVDCVHVLFDQGGDDSVKLAMRENRVLLTRNKNQKKVRDIHRTIHIVFFIIHVRESSPINIKNLYL